jgi:hypothetical protein
LETVKRFRLLVVKGSLLLTFAVAGLVFIFDATAAKGMLIGGLASTLGFWIMARNLELANKSGNRLKFAAYAWLVIRMALYTAVLVKGYSLDAPGLHGFFGAAGGLFTVRLVVTVLGLTGLDLEKGKLEDGEYR